MENCKISSKVAISYATGRNLSIRLQKTVSAIIITAYMDEAYGTRRYEADKIALLGLFAAGLLIAYFMTSSRYTIPAKAGTEIVEEIKRKGIPSFLHERGWQSFFLIKDAAGRTVGFTMDVFVDSTSEVGLNIQSADLLYIAGTYSRQNFRSDNSFDQFHWEIKTGGRGRKDSRKMVMDEDGMLTVTKLGRNRREIDYKPGPASIPEYLLGLVFSQILESEHSKAIIDVIDSDGKVLDMVVRRVRADGGGPLQTEAEYKLKVDFPDEAGYSQEVRFDDQGRVSKVLLEQKGVYFERASAEAVLREFPKWADYILFKDKLLEEGAE